MIKTCKPRLESTYQCKSSRGVISVFVVVVVYLGYLKSKSFPPPRAPPPPKKKGPGSPSNILLPLQYNVNNYIDKNHSEATRSVQMK